VIGGTTIAPTLVPEDALYYRSFEQGNFPFTVEEEDPVVTTENVIDASLVWAVTGEKANLGVKSVKSPILENEAGIQASANLTISLPDYGAGALYYSVFSGAQMPVDSLEISVNGVIDNSIFEPMTSFEQRFVALGIGANVVTFTYKYNPGSLPTIGFPSASAMPDRIGTVFIDDVYYKPLVIGF
jgi:hypothetical protein